MEREILENIRKIHASADLVYKSGDYTSATILYFKTVFSAIDLILLKSKGKTPKDHIERFRMLEDSYPELYEFLDKYFKVYRDTYSISIDKEICDKLKKDVNKIIREHRIEV